MVKTLKMNYDNAEIIKDNFYDARDDLKSKKEGFPESVDGGDGTEYIVEIITRTAEGAGGIAIYSEPRGGKMVNTVDKMKGMDEGVTQAFHETEKKIP